MNARRVLKQTAKGFGFAFVGLIVLVVATLVSIDLPFGRRIAAERVTKLLANSFKGSISIERIGSLGLTGASGVRVRLRDASGKQVAFADGADARIRPMVLVRSLFGGKSLEIDLPSASVAHADISLDTLPDGSLRLIHVFDPKSPSMPQGQTSAPSSGLILRLEDARLRHAWVHGQMASAPPIDAELSEAVAKLTKTPEALSISLSQAVLLARALPGGSNAKLNLSASSTLPSAPNAPMHVEGKLDGTLGKAPIAASGSMSGDVVSGRVDVVNAPPDAIRELAGVSVIKSVTTHWTVNGTLSRLAVKGDARVGSATLSVNGDVKIAPSISGTAHADVRSVNLSELVEGQGSSDLGATIDVTGTAASGAAPTGTFTIATLAGRFGPNALPVVRVRGEFNGKGVSAAGTVDEPGAPTDFSATFKPSPKGGSMQFHAAICADDLRKVRRVALGMTGAARINVDGTVDLGARAVTGHITGDLKRVSAPLFEMGHGYIAGTVSGPLLAPRFDANVGAEDLRVDKRQFTNVVVTAHGTPRNVHANVALDGVAGTPRITAVADVSLGSPVTLRGVHATIVRSTTTADITATNVQIGDTVRVDGLVVSGLGNPLKADLKIFPGGISVRGVTEGIELSKIAMLVALPLHAKTGTLALDTDVTARGSIATGHARVDLTGATVDDVRDVEAHVDVTLGDRKVEGRVRGRAGGAHVDVAAKDIRLGGPLVEARSWQSALGRLDVDVTLDIARLEEVLPEGTLPLNQIAGTLTVKGDIDRKEGSVPDVDVAVRTQGLSVAGLGKKLKDSGGKEIQGPPPWRLNGVDVDGAVSVREGGHVDLRMRVADPHGDLARLTASATLPNALLWTHPDQLTLDGLSTVPFKISLEIPRRKLSDLPAPIQEPGVDGAVALTVDASETLRAPKLAVSLTATGVRGVRRRRVTPVDLDLKGNYEAGTLDVTAAIKSQEAPAATIQSSVKVDAFALLGRRTPLDWDATLHGEFAKFPISALSAVEDQRIDGTIDGKLDAATGTRTKPSLHTDLEISALQLGRAKYPKGGFKADLDDKKLGGEVTLTQTDGFVKANGGVGVIWRGPLAVGIDSKSAATATVQASKFRMAALQPFVQDIVEGVDGRLDANVAFEVQGGGRVVSSKGSLEITAAKFEFPSFGDGFQNVRAKITLSPDGLVKVDDVYAEGVTGKLTASGEARLNGLAVQSAQGTIQIPKRDPLPIAIEGQTIAEAYGTFKVETSAPPTPTHLGLTIDIPSATVRLADKSTHDLQDLSQAKDIHIGVRTTSGDFMLVPTGPGGAGGPGSTDPPQAHMTTDVLVRIHDMEVQRGTDLRVRLEGDPSIHVADTTAMSGQIQLREGFLEVQGKRFEIQNGTISFVGEPDNPELVVTAAWTAPEGTVVFADFVGPLKTGKVTLRSDPGHTNTEILSLILFGTTDGDTGPQGGDSTAGSAAGVGGGIATQGINKALDDLTGLDVTTRIDTSDSANPRPEVEVRVARDVTVAVAHVLGVPPPGTDPDLNFATLDWRFLRNWSVETTFGDAGSSILDLVWQFRY